MYFVVDGVDVCACECVHAWMGDIRYALLSDSLVTVFVGSDKLGRTHHREEYKPNQWRGEFNLYLALNLPTCCHTHTLTHTHHLYTHIRAHTHTHTHTHHMYTYTYHLTHLFN